ncbi:hypothetical protein HAX54_003948 [Datura stramonium]|uniref:Uncharacterized protein n=1 Tax=Datura stramonium TaxID=4076 RepID=A0ABS8RTX5_DATST|nr:hypothetical protein [Datura stramonium]
MEKLSINMADFEEAAKLVQPSSRREGFSAIPNVKWEDVGGLDSLRHDFDRYIVRRIKNPKDYTGPEILNKYVGESELAIRTLFTRARTCAPCILFFDEMDALTTKRGKEGGWVVERLLNQLLIELDGADQRKGVYVIGATNRPEVMDRAILRPGSVNLMTIGRDDACKNFSGADLAALMNEAAMVALEDKLIAMDTSCGDTSSTIKESHFKRALEKISPSVSDKNTIRFYQKTSEQHEIPGEAVERRCLGNFNGLEQRYSNPRNLLQNHDIQAAKSTCGSFDELQINFREISSLRVNIRSKFQSTLALRTIKSEN